MGNHVIDCFWKTALFHVEHRPYFFSRLMNFFDMNELKRRKGTTSYFMSVFIFSVGPIYFALYSGCIVPRELFHVKHSTRDNEFNT